LPSPFGLDERFLWRSLDMDSDVGEQSVLENYLGTVKFKGGEHIWSLRNGLHAYFIMNDQRQQVAEVPVSIAQDHENPHDARVIVPYKCVSCHMPKGGIRHFDDVISRITKTANSGRPWKIIICPIWPAKSRIISNLIRGSCARLPAARRRKSRKVT
jgi:hypothetical protein